MSDTISIKIDPTSPAYKIVKKAKASPERYIEVGFKRLEALQKNRDKKAAAAPPKAPKPAKKAPAPKKNGASAKPSKSIGKRVKVEKAA